MVRESELAYLTRAGAEIGVASTKAFTTQLAALFLLTLTLAQLRGSSTDDAGSRAPEACATCRAALRRVLALEPQIIALGRAISRARRTRCSSAAACTTRSRWKAR